MTAVTLYATTLFVTGLLLLALGLYTTANKRLVRHDLDRRLVHYHTLRAACVPLVFLVSIPIAQTSPSTAEYSWLSIVVLFGALRWWYRNTR